MALTPVQERTMRELMGRDVPRPSFPAGLAARLTGLVESMAGTALRELGDGEILWLSKSGLTDLHARCEGLYAARSEAPFEPSLALAVGQLVHRAIEADVVGERLAEPELAERALRRLRASDQRFDAFAGALDAVELAELVGEAARRLALFRATFPPLEKSWAPIPELRLKTELAGGRLVLAGAVDLCLFRPREEAPLEARRLFVELKTGVERPEFVDDLRFYALVSTLRFGVPPFRVGTLLLEDGSYRFEDVTEDLLEAAARRVADAVSRHVALLRGEEPALRPGPWCSWCPRRESCPVSAARGR